MDEDWGKDRVCQIVSGSGMNFIDGKWYYAAKCEEDTTDMKDQHEQAIRKALAAFEPMVPPHTMTELTNIIEKHLEDVRKFEEEEGK